MALHLCQSVSYRTYTIHYESLDELKVVENVREGVMQLRTGSYLYEVRLPKLTMSSKGNKMHMYSLSLVVPSDDLAGNHNRRSW